MVYCYHTKKKNTLKCVVHFGTVWWVEAGSTLRRLRIEGKKEII